MRPRSLAPTRSNHTVEIRLQLRARTFRQMLEHVLYPSCGTLHVAKIAGPGIRARRSGLSNHLCPLRRGHLQTASARFAYGTSTYVRDIYILVTTAHAGIQAGASRHCLSRWRCDLPESRKMPAVSRETYLPARSSNEGTFAISFL